MEKEAQMKAKAVLKSLLALSLIFVLVGSLALACGGKESVSVPQTKVLVPLDVSLSLADGNLSIGGTFPVILSLTPLEAVSVVTAEFEDEGVIAHIGQKQLAWQNPPSHQEQTVESAFEIEGSGEGRLTARVLVLNEAMEILYGRSATLYFLVSEDDVLTGTSSLIALKLERLERDLESGAITQEEYDEALDAILGGGAAETSSVAPGGGSITVKGRITWTDFEGRTHPVRFAPVEIRDDELIGSDLLTTVSTNASGNYWAWYPDNNDGWLQDGRDIFIRVKARSVGFEIGHPRYAEIYRLQSSVKMNRVDNTTTTINLRANRKNPNNTAFSIHDALVMASRYVQRVNGAMLPRIRVNFPTSSTNYDGTNVNINIVEGDQFDWDVIQHEYGHYVQSKLNITHSPGGCHFGDVNLGELNWPRPCPADSPRLAVGKDGGIKLAWGEGWATFFALSLQQEMRAASFGILRVGDTDYNDRFDQTITYSIEAQTGGNSLGEDNELSVQRILWDIYDAANDAGDEVTLGDQAVWNTVKAVGAPYRLDRAWDAFSAGQTPRQLFLLGDIFAEHNVAPDPTAPLNGTRAPATPPTFTWDRNGFGPTNRNNRFTVEFWDDVFSTRLFLSLLLVAPNGTTSYSYTPSQNDWDAIRSGVRGVINWVVRGRNTNTPATPDPGFYVSSARRLFIARDFGDAPDPFIPPPGATGIPGRYPSLLSNNGARHNDWSYEWLGPSVNGEPDSKQVNLDEFDDGWLNYPSTNPLTVRISTTGQAGRYAVATGHPLYLNVWFDRNANGVWEPGEREIWWEGGPGFMNAVSPNLRGAPRYIGNNIELDFNVPPPGRQFWVRFRLDWMENTAINPPANIDPTLAGPKGLAQFGEVEDYPLAAPSPNPVFPNWYTMMAAVAAAGGLGYLILRRRLAHEQA